MKRFIVLASSLIVTPLLCVSIVFQVLFWAATLGLPDIDKTYKRLCEARVLIEKYYHDTDRVPRMLQDVSDRYDVDYETVFMGPDWRPFEYITSNKTYIILCHEVINHNGDISKMTISFNLKENKK